MEAGHSQICATDRLVLRQIQMSDAAFILALLNEPSFLASIGDKGVRNLDDARQYISNGPQASYQQHGFGLYLVQLRETAVPIGICGLLRRAGLDDPDIGYAFLPAFWSQGYAVEAASAVLELARKTLGLSRIVAITAPDNHASMRVLNRIGLRFDQMIRLPGAATESRLFVSDS